ncbi:MAG TPA: serine hydrolase domain-containing protein [Xanthomonadaceae bacterium]|nr:serine hydrolase domain-containing protein [Xanthomonadaceae bacterium]
MRTSICLYLLLCCATVCADTARTLERELARVAGSRDAPGVVLVVATQGEVAFLGAAGHADREARQPLQTTTPMPLGELTRAFTAALALQLAQEGAVDLDASLDAFIDADEVDFDPAAISLRQLLTHQAGLPSTRLRGMYREANAPPSADALLSARDFYFALPPGELVSTSSLGYVLAARVLQRAAGQDFETLLRSRLLDPLQMTSTGFVDALPLVPTHQRGRAQPGLLARDLPAVGLAASAEDLGRWLAALTAPQSPLAGRDELFRAQNRDSPLSFDEDMGLGFAVTDSIVEGTGRIAFAMSGYPGYRAQLRIAVDHGVAVLAMSNGRDAYGPLGALVDKAFDAHLARSGQTVEAARRSRERIPDRVAWPAQARRIEPAPRYATPFGMITTTPVAEGFNAEVFGRGFSVRPREDGWMDVRYRLFGMIPLAFSVLNRVLVAPAEVDGRHVLLAWFRGRTFLLGSSFEAPPLTSDAAALSGNWVLESPDALVEQLEIRSAHIAIEDGLLTLGYELPFMITLRPRLAVGTGTDGHLRLLGIGPNLGERILVGRDEAGDWLEYSGYRLRRAP